jgi:hypothetical protein
MLNLLVVVRFEAQANFAASSAATKDEACFKKKRIKIDSKIIILLPKSKSVELTVVGIELKKMFNLGNPFYKA